MPNYTERFSPRDKICIVTFVAYTDALVEMSKFISLLFFPNMLVFEMVT